MKKIILINIVLFFVLFCVLEFISWLYLRNDAKEYMADYNEMEKNQNGTNFLTQRYAPVKKFNQETDLNMNQINVGKKNK